MLGTAFVVQTLPSWPLASLRTPAFMYSATSTRTCNSGATDSIRLTWCCARVLLQDLDLSWNVLGSKRPDVPPQAGLDVAKAGATSAGDVSVVAEASEGVQALVEALAQHPSLTHLSMAHTQLGLCDTRALSKALMVRRACCCTRVAAPLTLGEHPCRPTIAL